VGRGLAPARHPDRPRLALARVDGHEQQRVHHPPPVRLGEVTPESLAEQRQRRPLRSPPPDDRRHPNLRGRVTAAFLTAEAAATLAGAATGPVLAQSAGLPTAAATAAAVMLVAAALARLTIPRLATLIPVPPAHRASQPSP